MISARTGVLVAPVVLAGYSVYHLDFAGTLSLKPGKKPRNRIEKKEKDYGKNEPSSGKGY